MKTRKGPFVDRINAKDDFFFIGNRSDWPGTNPPRRKWPRNKGQRKNRPGYFWPRIMDQGFGILALIILTKHGIIFLGRNYIGPLFLSQNILDPLFLDPTFH